MADKSDEAAPAFPTNGQAHSTEGSFVPPVQPPTGPNAPPAPPPPGQAQKKGRTPPAALPSPKQKRKKQTGVDPEAMARVRYTADPGAYYRDLRDANPIADVCRELSGERITQETATTLLVDCPCHESKSKKSLVVQKDKGLWNCFGCGEGGDVLHLVEFIYTGAVTKCGSEGVTEDHRLVRGWLADRAGMPPLSKETEGFEQYAEAQAVFAAMTEAMTIFYERLVAPENAEVLQWLQAKYGITRETISRLKIGYSGGPCCFGEVVKRGHDPGIVKKTGLFRRIGSFASDIKSFFKNRITFPYWRHGQVEYAIGRKTPWTEENKYEQAKYKKLAVYDKEKYPYISKAVSNSVLFGEEFIGGQLDAALITEGITDAIAVQQVGFPTISPVTVRLKAEDVERVVPKLKRVGTAYIIQDNELSGVGLQGALDTAEVLEKHGILVKVGVIPLDEQQEHARSELRELLGGDVMERYVAARSQKKRGVLKDALGEGTEQFRRAEELVGRSKIDLCDYLRDNPSREALDALLATAVKPVEWMIDHAEKIEDSDAQLKAIKPILIRILLQEPPIQTELFKRVKQKLDLSWGLGDLRKVAKGNAGASRRTTPGSTNGGVIECNDNFLGDSFVREHGADVRFCDQTKAWHIWDGRRWKADTHLTIEHRARLTVEPIGKLAEERAAEAAKEGDDGDAKRLGAFAQRALSMRGVSAALDVAAGTGRLEDGSPICLPLASFDGPDTHYLLNCANGVLDLRDGALKPHDESKSLHITKLVPTEYRREAECPEFLTALDAIFEADRDRERADRLINLLQVGLGYSMLGVQTHHLLFLLYGPEGRNGKSMIVQIVLAILGHEYGTTAPPGLLRQKKGESHPTELADLHGRRFVSAIETGRGERLNEALVKALTGGDRVKARRMREDFWEFDPTHHMWIATNDLPKADAFDRALWTRFRVILFRRRFLKPGDDGYEESDLVCRADDGLAARIIEREAEGVLSWMVDGCRRYLDSGQVPNPPESREALEQYRDANDPIGEFLEECCYVYGSGAEDRLELGDEFTEATAKLYFVYEGWKQDRHERPMTKIGFSRALAARGFPDRRVGIERVRSRCGLRLKTDEGGAS